jgi:hypothetical protein
MFAFTGTALFAQDDELPPPTSKPKTDNNSPVPPGGNTTTTAPDGNGFQGFSKTKKLDLSKFIIEPDFNLGFSSNEIDLGLSPYVGYNVWKGLFLGGGFTYLYTGYRNIPFVEPSGQTYYANASSSTYGGGVFAQYNIWRGFFARVKLEVLHSHTDDIYSNNISVQLNPSNNSYQVIIPKIDVTVPDMLVGVGYNLLRSKNFFFPIIVSYNVLSTVVPKSVEQYSIYPNHFVVQLGFVNVF